MIYGTGSLYYTLMHTEFFNKQTDKTKIYQMYNTIQKKSKEAYTKACLVNHQYFHNQQYQQYLLKISKQRLNLPISYWRSTGKHD